MALLCIYKVMTSRFSHRGAKMAFTLIEVVMAMAVVSFALLAITGLLPIGLQTMRDSQNDQATGTIANQIRGDLQQIAFTTDPNNPNPQVVLSSLASSTNYYTVEGLKTNSATTAAQVYYRATFAITNAGVNGLGFGGTTTVPNNAAAVTVTLGYPAPAYTHKTSFTLFATRQVGL
jgi:uncharacterized protein (TIGR02598 family)